MTWILVVIATMGGMNHESRTYPMTQAVCQQTLQTAVASWLNSGFEIKLAECRREGKA